jgi:predicted unusual protein kinase regulating ubiquinone biosynthesis (AarF/ABC1/UbiB family)
MQEVSGLANCAVPLGLRPPRRPAVVVCTAGVTVAVAALLGALSRRHGHGGPEPGVAGHRGGSGGGGGRAVSSTTFVSRNASLVHLATRVGASAASTRARKVFASAARKEQIDEALQLRTAQQVTETLGGMKGAMMKIGQLASFLDDAMPGPVREVLAQLQQDAPPMSPELSSGVVQAELGAAPEKVFSRWDPVPIAAASIGQVHRAMTKDGRAVAVKVQYPGIGEAVRADLMNLDLAGFGLGSMFPGLDSKALVSELRERLTEELDYTKEASNQRQFSEWYRGHPFISVPGVVGELSTQKVLTTELAEGVRFEVMESWAQEERDLAAEAIFRFVFRSLYRFHAFNGDPHPGNYLFRPDGRVTFLDFGLVKRLSPGEVSLLFDLVRSSVVEGDPERVRDACERAGFINRGADVSDDRLAQFMEIFWDAVRSDDVTTITADWASEVARRYLSGRVEFSDVMQHAGMPPQYAVLQRINLGLLAILGRLEATANWRRIAEELWPTAAPPSTPLGEAEAEWWERAHPERFLREQRRAEPDDGELVRSRDGLGKGVRSGPEACNGPEGGTLA